MPVRAFASEDATRFVQLQEELRRQFERVFPDSQRERAVVVVPSLTLDPGELAKIAGAHHYEERLLCLLLLLRMPRTQLIYLTSQPIHPTIVDYYLHLLPGIPMSHARRRLTLLSCNDASPKPLSQKLLERPRLLERIKERLAARQDVHMSCFNATSLERKLAMELGIPLYATDPDLADLGSKSGSREVFREAGVALPDGRERLRDMSDAAEALTELKRRHPSLRRAVVKLNDGFSGEGNALFSFEGGPSGGGLEAWVKRLLPARIAFEARGETWDRYAAKFAEMQGIVECFIEGDEKRSPSAQCRIDPLGRVAPISTHDQVLGGPAGQVFLGCTFPADEAYRLQIQEAGLRVAEVLRDKGALGRFGVDFVSVREGEEWRHYAIEINLRKGGTTHPNLMLHFLADGAYDVASGLYRTPAGHARYYYATDNLEDEAYRGLTPDDLIDIAVCHDLHFHGATQQGVVFHLIGALSEFGKLGVVCIGDSPARAYQLYEETVNVLAGESRQPARVYPMGY
jgi:hypothetical protein